MNNSHLAAFESLTLQMCQTLIATADAAAASMPAEKCAVLMKSTHDLKSALRGYLAYYYEIYTN